MKRYQKQLSALLEIIPLFFQRIRMERGGNKDGFIPETVPQLASIIRQRIVEFENHDLNSVWMGPARKSVPKYLLAEIVVFLLYIVSLDEMVKLFFLGNLSNKEIIKTWLQYDVRHPNDDVLDVQVDQSIIQTRRITENWSLMVQMDGEKPFVRKSIGRYVTIILVRVLDWFEDGVDPYATVLDWLTHMVLRYGSTRTSKDGSPSDLWFILSSNPDQVQNALDNLGDKSSLAEYIVLWDRLLQEQFIPTLRKIVAQNSVERP